MDSKMYTKEPILWYIDILSIMVDHFSMLFWVTNMWNMWLPIYIKILLVMADNWTPGNNILSLLDTTLKSTHHQNCSKIKRITFRN